MTTLPILISRDEVAELLDWNAVYEATKSGLRAGGAAPESSAVSAQVTYGRGSLHLKAAALEVEKVISVKSNLRPNRGGVSGVLLAYDLDTERLSGIIDAGFMTALRTGAIAAVAAECLTSASPVTVAILGVGPVGVQSASALLKVLDVTELRLWSTGGPRLAEVADDLARHAKVAACPSVREAAQGADVIVTATPATAPILTVEELHPGTLILAMGADTVGKRELSPEVLEQADVVADVPADALRVGESAYLSSDRRRDVVPISRVLQTSDQWRGDHPYLVFDSVGSSYVDAAVTSVIMSRARSRGIGREIRW